jgi:cyclophilin family peptidyl-prolyl cis-trans isomerase
LISSLIPNYILKSGDPSFDGPANSSIDLTIKHPSSYFAINSKDPSKRYFNDEISQKLNKLGLVATANTGPNLNTS